VSLPGGWELVLVVIVIMVLFGAKRLPDASRSLGRSLRIFKAETKGLRDDDGPSDSGYDARRHDREMYERTVGSPPAVPPVAPPVVPPVVPPVSAAYPDATDTAQPRQP
jgi:sec-independent protein translocase protein TatA